MIDLNELVREASEHLKVSGDKKAWVGEAEMRALISAGAKVIVNRKQIDGAHLTEVIFKNILFTHADKHPLIPNVNQLH